MPRKFNIRQCIIVLRLTTLNTNRKFTYHIKSSEIKRLNHVHVLLIKAMRLNIYFKDINLLYNSTSLAKNIFGITDELLIKFDAFYFVLCVLKITFLLFNGVRHVYFFLISRNKFIVIITFT
jgi:hypothetical protein